MTGEEKLGRAKFWCAPRKGARCSVPFEVSRAGEVCTGDGGGSAATSFEPPLHDGQRSHTSHLASAEHAPGRRGMASPTMALSQPSLASALRFLLPQSSSRIWSTQSPSAFQPPRQLALPLLPSLSIAIPAAFQLGPPALLPGLWESILRAVPKKKTSHSKSRHRQMVGKALKDVTALNKCPACGNLKRAHYLCPYCVKSRSGLSSGSL
jgi:large subunit ribosomal protein L32